MSDTIQVGCMSCKRTRGQKVQKTLDELMPVAFDRLQKEAAKHGIVIPEEFHEKMQKWCKKNGLLPADVAPVAEATVPVSN
jgi:hypothetical protein